MALDPWSYAEKTRNEYAEQVALFMWANMAAHFGVELADNPLSYTKPGFAISFRPMGTANDCLPELRWLHAIKNAGHGDAIRGAMSKAEGVKAGVPDIFLPVPVRGNRVEGAIAYTINAHGLYIELKRLKSARGAAGSTSQVQDEWRDYLIGAGYRVEVCHGWLEARKAILQYLRKG